MMYTLSQSLKLKRIDIILNKFITEPLFPYFSTHIMNFNFTTHSEFKINEKTIFYIYNGKALFEHIRPIK